MKFFVNPPYSTPSLHDHINLKKIGTLSFFCETLIDLLVKTFSSRSFKNRRKQCHVPVAEKKDKEREFSFLISTNNSNSKQLDSSTLPASNLAEIKFNELDNWLAIMELDPPVTFEEKHAMYQRLIEILADMFEPKNKRQRNYDDADDYAYRIPRRPPEARSKHVLFREMRKIIDR